MITKEGSKFVLKSKDGAKVLGRFGTILEAKKREKQIQFFKALKKQKPKRTKDG